MNGSTEGRLAPPVETAFYRSVQEALTNAVRHAQATRVDVEIRRAEGTVRCSVRDDGIGFGVSTVLSRRGERGLGLIGIRERADGLGGTLSVKRAQGQGDVLIIDDRIGHWDGAAVY